MTLTLTERPRTGHAERYRRAVVSVDVRDLGSWDDAVRCTVAFLHQADALFAVEECDSQVSRIRAGKLPMDEADPRMQEVVQLCAEVEAETDGYFSTHWHGLFDPTGLIKGWAAGRASQMLRGYGSYNHAVSVGSDIRLLGEPQPGRPWSIGISDPLHPIRLLTTVGGRDFAVATSAPDRHGRRIINPHT